MENKKLILFCKRKLPTICTVASALFGGVALFFTGKATVKAVRKYDELKSEGVEMTPKLIIKQFVPYYIPAIGFATTSLALNITGNTVHANRNRVLSLAATSAAETLRDFKAKSIDILGEDKVKEVEIAQAKEAPLLEAKRDPKDTDPPIIVYDLERGEKIKTTYRKLYEAEAEVNFALSEGGWTKGEISVKSFYRHLGIDEKRVSDNTYPAHIGFERIWNAEYMVLNYETNWVSFYHEEMFDEDGTPVVLLTYNPQPEYSNDIEKYLMEN